MATSGSSNYNLTALQIITEAYALIRVAIEEEPLTNAQSSEAMVALNTMVKAWTSDGLHMWCKSRGCLFLTPEQQRYDLSPTSSDHHALVDDIAQTALAAAAIAGAGTITVDSIAGIANGDHIGIELTSGTMQWTTVNGAPAGVTVTLAATLTGAASDDGVVYAYTTKLNRPSRILGVQHRTDDGTDMDILIRENPDYFNLPNKDAEGTIVQIYYDPQLTKGYLYVWPTSDNAIDTLRFSFERPIEDFDALTDNPDLPQEWLEPLAWNLAYRLSWRHSFPIAERAQLRADAMAMKEKLMGFDREYGSVFFQPQGR